MRGSWILFFLSLFAFAAGGNAHSSDSLYLLDSKWMDQDGKTIPISALKGKPRLVVMAYTSCEYSCPLIIQDLLKLDGEIPVALRDRYQITFFSMDPEHDTPRQLRKYLEQKHLAPGHWLMLTSSEDQVRELAALLRIKYKKESWGGFSHSNAITVLDEQGRIRYQRKALNEGIGPAASALRSLIDH